jgi:hypothetical protein
VAQKKVGEIEKNYKINLDLNRNRNCYGGGIMSDLLK